MAVDLEEARRCWRKMDRKSPLVEAAACNGWNTRLPVLTSMVLGKNTDAEAPEAINDTSIRTKGTDDFMVGIALVK